jgi:arabinofuranosyltransferase
LPVSSNPSYRQPISQVLGTRKSYSMLLLALAFSLLVSSIYWEHVLEDAMISFRYALRLAEHYPLGFWNREGPPVEGCTSTLWVVLLSLAGSNVDHIIDFAKACGLLCYFAIPTALLWLSTVEINPNEMDPTKFREACWFSALGSLVYIPLAWYATTGMETALFTLLVTLLVFVPLRVTNVAVLTCLNVLIITTRPDGVLFAAGSAAYFCFFDEVNRRRRVAILALCLAAFAAVVAARYAYFGELMPNTYYAKAGGSGFSHVGYGLKYAGTWAASHWYLLIPMLLLGRQLLRKNERARFPTALGIALLGYCAIIIKVGGDNPTAFPLWRHAVQVIPLIFFLTFYALAALRTGLPIKLLVLLCIAVMPLFALLPAWQSAFLRDQASSGIHRATFFANQPFNPFFLWLKSISGEHTLIATGLAGELPLVVDTPSIDVLGLNDSYIAHHGTFDPKGPVDSKSDMNYVISRRPDIIEGKIPASLILDGHDYAELIANRTQMVETMLSNPYFKENYLFVTDAPYQYFDRAIFIHKDFYEKSLQNGITLKAVPVTLAIKYASS